MKTTTDLHTFICAHEPQPKVKQLAKKLHLELTKTELTELFIRIKLLSHEQTANH